MNGAIQRNERVKCPKLKFEGSSIFFIIHIHIFILSFIFTSLFKEYNIIFKLDLFMNQVSKMD